MKNIISFQELREDLINFFKDYCKMLNNVIHDVKCRKAPKILTPQQMLQRLSIAVAQVKAGNTSENLLNEIHQMMYFLYQEKEITKKVYNNIMNSIKL